MDPNSLPGLLEPRTLLFFALFVTPGWLMRLFWRHYRAAEPEPIGAEILATVSLSLLSTAVSFVPFAFLLDRTPADVDRQLILLWLLLAVAVVPVVAAYLYVWHRAGKRPDLGVLVWGPKLPGREDAEKAEPAAPLPTALDAVFGSGRRYLVHFSGPDGKVRVGYFGERSHSSLFPNEQQIFLEELLMTDDGGNPLGREIDPRKKARGAIIRVAEHPILEVEELEFDPSDPEGRHPLEIRFAGQLSAGTDAEEERGTGTHQDDPA